VGELEHILQIKCLGVEVAHISLPYWPHLLTPRSHNTAINYRRICILCAHLYQTWQSQMALKIKEVNLGGEVIENTCIPKNILIQLKKKNHAMQGKHIFRAIQAPVTSL
jgi:hypothetical protein